jgi:hypothetical protein
METTIMSTTSNTEHAKRNERISLRGIVLATVVAVAMLFGGRSALAADVCWQSGVTPEGHHFKVVYVPYESIRTMADRTPHLYQAIAYAVPGIIYAANDVPCSRIPWAHEMKHLDGWVHDASGRWTDKHEVGFTEADVRLQIWTVVETEAGLKAVRESSVAALPDAQ